MASQSKRGRLRRSATHRSRTDASPDCPEGTDPKKKIVRGRAAAPRAQKANGGQSDSRQDATRQDVTLSDKQLLPSERAQQANGGAGAEGYNFKHALLHQANLAAANLSGATLDHADFVEANLANANLKGASLRFAALNEAKLDSADLSGADLRYARLNQADFTAANLTGSALDYADFSGANLADADLRGAHLRYAKNLTPAQLEQARTDESTIRPFHYLELAPLSQTRSHVRRWDRPLMAAGLVLLACLTGALALLDLARQPQPSTSHTARAIAPKPNVTPTLASLTPSTLLSRGANTPSRQRSASPGFRRARHLPRAAPTGERPNVAFGRFDDRKSVKGSSRLATWSAAPWGQDWRPR